MIITPTGVPNVRSVEELATELFRTGSVNQRQAVESLLLTAVDARKIIKAVCLTMEDIRVNQLVCFKLVSKVLGDHGVNWEEFSKEVADLNNELYACESISIALREVGQSLTDVTSAT